MWIRSWVVVTALFLLKRFVQMEQGHGFSPVWARSWGAIWRLSPNLQAQMEQGYGFSPVWARCFRERRLNKNNHRCSVPYSGRTPFAVRSRLRREAESLNDRRGSHFTGS